MPAEPIDAGLDEHRAVVGRGALHQHGRTRSHSQVRDEPVVGRRGSVREVHEQGAAGVDLAERHADLVDHLRSVRVQPAAALRGVGPPFGQLRRRIGEHRDVQHEHREARLTDRTFPDGAGEQGLARVEAELGAEEMDDARAFGRGEQRAGFGRIARERLLAQHVLAGRDRLARERRVGVRRGRDRDRVDAVDRERIGERRARVGHGEGAGARRGLLGIAADDGAHVEAGGAQRAHVREAPEARPDHDDAAHSST